jgi:hypothetical protein
MTKLALFIEGVEVDLFKDEIVTVNSSVANVQDISKVFSDFSQSFLVPASPRNNAIFEHWYESDVIPTIDQNLRRDAFIEIETQPFRTGKIQMNEAVIKNGQVVSYSLNFFGALVSLKERFGELTLGDLDYSSLNFVYDAQNVLDRVEDTTTDYDVRFPLVSSKRFWNDVTSDPDNIFEATKGISFRELFPAVRVAKIFEFIQSQLGVTFNSSFFNSKRWTDLYFRNQLAESFTILTNKHLVGFPNSAVPPPFSTQISINTTTSEITIKEEYRVEISFANLTMSSGSATLFVEILKNGVLSSTTSISAGTTFKKILITAPNPTTNVYKIIIYSDQTITVNVDLEFRVFYEEGSQVFGKGTTDPISLVVNDISDAFSSSVKIADFFSGILKTFNLICEGVDETTFNIEPLQDWYSLGKEIDITTDVINSSGIKKVPLYKQIAFKYKESKSFANKNFLKLFNREYGNLDSSFIYDGSEFKVELPFENNQFVEINNTDVFCAYCLDENKQAFIPEPMLLYFSGNQSSGFRFKKESTEVIVTDYALFNSVNTTGFSLCFGNEFNIVTQETEPNSLYNTYYANHLGNLYNLQQRLFSFTAYLPTGLISALRLNDKLIIKDKRYLINDISTTLNNGEVKMNLLLDLEPIVPCSECFIVKFILDEIEYSVEVNLAGQENGFNYYTGVDGENTFTIGWENGNWILSVDDGESEIALANVESFDSCIPFNAVWDKVELLTDLDIAPCFVFDCDECVNIAFDITVEEETTNYNFEMIWDGTRFNGADNDEFFRLIFEDGQWNLYSSNDNITFDLVATASEECDCPQGCESWTIAEPYEEILTNFTSTSCE